MAKKNTKSPFGESKLTASTCFYLYRTSFVLLKGVDVIDCEDFSREQSGILTI